MDQLIIILKEISLSSFKKKLVDQHANVIIWSSYNRDWLIIILKGFIDHHTKHDELIIMLKGMS